MHDKHQSAFSSISTDTYAHSSMYTDVRISAEANIHTHARTPASSLTQCLIVFLLWVINFRIVRAREALSTFDGPTRETLAPSITGKDNDALDQDLAADTYSTHSEI